MEAAPCGKTDCTGYDEFGAKSNLISEITTLLSYFRCVNCSEFGYPSLYVAKLKEEKDGSV